MTRGGATLVKLREELLIKRCPVDQTQQTQEHVSEQKNKESK
jgi:hypothetical protein